MINQRSGKSDADPALPGPPLIEVAERLLGDGYFYG
jgi:hypothetical protein